MFTTTRATLSKLFPNFTLMLMKTLTGRLLKTRQLFILRIDTRRVIMSSISFISLNANGNDDRWWRKPKRCIVGFTKNENSQIFPKFPTTAMAHPLYVKDKIAAKVDKNSWQFCWWTKRPHQRWDQPSRLRKRRVRVHFCYLRSKSKSFWNKRNARFVLLLW